jgi:hypothetical protein
MRKSQTFNIDAFVKSRKSTTNVIPAKAGIQKYQMVTKALDPGFRRGDDFLRVRQYWIPTDLQAGKCG